MEGFSFDWIVFLSGQGVNGNWERSLDWMDEVKMLGEATTLFPLKIFGHVFC